MDNQSIVAIVIVLVILLAFYISHHFISKSMAKDETRKKIIKDAMTDLLGKSFKINSEPFTVIGWDFYGKSMRCKGEYGRYEEIDYRAVKHLISLTCCPGNQMGDMPPIPPPAPKPLDHPRLPDGTPL